MDARLARSAADDPLRSEVLRLAREPEIHQIPVEMAVESICPDMLDDEMFIHSMIDHNPAWLQHASPRLRGSHEFVIGVVNGCRYTVGSAKYIPTYRGPQGLSGVVHMDSRLKRNHALLFELAAHRDTYTFARHFLDGIRWGSETDVVRGASDVGPLVSKLLSMDGMLLQHFPLATRDDKERVRAAVASTGASLQYATARLQSCRDIVAMAVSSEGWSFEYAADPLQRDRAFVRAMSSIDMSAFSHAHRSIRSDPSFALSVLASRRGNQHWSCHHWCVAVIDTGLLHDKPLLLQAVRAEPSVYAYARRHRDDTDVLAAALESRRRAVQSLAQSTRHGIIRSSLGEWLRADRGVGGPTLTCCSPLGRHHATGLSLMASAPAKMRLDIDVARQVVSVDGGELQYFADFIRNSDEMRLEMVASTTGVVSAHVRSDPQKSPAAYTFQLARRIARAHHNLALVRIGRVLPADVLTLVTGFVGVDVTNTRLRNLSIIALDRLAIHLPTFYVPLYEPRHKQSPNRPHQS